MGLGLGIGIPFFRRALESSFFDEFGTPAAAYSLRSLNGANGNVVRVRRSSDDAEQDFTPTEISDGTLLSWVGVGNNGAVTTLYDQAASNDATQSTASAQPLIVEAGVLVEENGLPAIKFDGVDDDLKAIVGISSYPISAVSVQNDDAVNTGYAWSLNNDASSTQYYSHSDLSSSSVAFHTIRNSASVFYSTAIGNIQNLIFSRSIANNDHAFNVNAGVLNTNSTSTTPPNANNIAIGRLRFVSSAFHYSGTIQEIIIYNADKSTDRTAIETNINNYYSIY